MDEENAKEKRPEASVKAQFSKSGGLQSQRDLSAAALGAGIYPRKRLADLSSGEQTGWGC